MASATEIAKRRRGEQVEKFLEAVELILSEEGQRFYPCFRPDSLTPEEQARLAEFYNVVQPLPPDSSTTVNTHDVDDEPFTEPPPVTYTRAIAVVIYSGANRTASAIERMNHAPESSTNATTHVGHADMGTTLHDVLPTIPIITSNTGDSTSHANITDESPTSFTGPNDDLSLDSTSFVGAESHDDGGVRLPLETASNGELESMGFQEKTALLRDRSNRGRPRRYPRASNSGPRNNSWRPMIAMAEIHLDPKLEELIDNMSEKSGADIATSIFAGCKSAGRPIVEYERPNYRELAKLCLNIIDTTPEKPKKRTPSTGLAVFEYVAWCFKTLAVGDMVVEMSRKGSTVCTQNATRKHLEWAAARKDRQKVIDGLTIARNICFVCGEFGVGTLFYFPTILTMNFLKDQVTKNGEHFDAMKKNFATRGFQDVIDRSGATNVGAAMRAHLKDVYKLDQIEGDPDASDPTESVFETPDQTDSDSEMSTTSGLGS